MAASYVLAGAIGIRLNRGPYVEPVALRHLAALVALLFVIFAAGAWLSVPGLLTSDAGTFQGASYTDVYARMPVLKTLAVVGILGAVVALAQIYAGRAWPLLGAMVLYLAVSIGGSAYAAILQRFVVAPNEQVQGDAVHPAQHRGDAPGVRAGQRRGARAARATPC